MPEWQIALRIVLVPIAIAIFLAVCRRLKWDPEKVFQVFLTVIVLSLFAVLIYAMFKNA